MGVVSRWTVSSDYGRRHASPGVSPSTRGLQRWLSTRSWPVCSRSKLLWSPRRALLLCRKSMWISPDYLTQATHGRVMGCEPVTPLHARPATATLLGGRLRWAVGIHAQRGFAPPTFPQGHKPTGPQHFVFNAEEDEALQRAAAESRNCRRAAGDDESDRPLHSSDLVTHLKNYQKMELPFQRIDDGIGGRFLSIIGLVPTIHLYLSSKPNIRHVCSQPTRIIRGDLGCIMLRMYKSPILLFSWYFIGSLPSQLTTM